jgi:hypothetical protein
MLMTIAGISIILILGLCNLTLILFQLASGLRLIRVRIGIHKKTGILLLILAVLHGGLAYLTQ